MNTKFSVHLADSPATLLIIELYDFKIGTMYLPELAQVIIIPSFIGGAGDIKVTADVGEYQAVFLHSGQNDLIGGRERTDIKTGFQTYPCTKWQRRKLPAGTVNFVAGRMYIRRLYFR